MRGEVKSVEERFSSGYRITMGSGFNTVDCNVREEFGSDVIALRKGQEIEVVGTVEESFIGFDLYDCRVTKNIP